MPENCFCDSHKSFKQCCAPFLNGSKAAKTPKQLMRSRYTAYALGNQAEYLLATWLPETSKRLAATSLSEKNPEWVKLEILNSHQKADQGRVEFNAYYKTEDGSLKVLHEKSTFRRMNGHWYYVEGEIETIKKQDWPAWHKFIL